MVRFVVVVLVAATLLSHVRADEDSHRAEVIQLLELTRVKQMVDQMRPRLDSQFEKVVADMQFTADQKEREDAFRSELNAVINETLAWNRMQSEFADIYMDAFSESELQEMNRFYSSEVGQKTISQMPVIMQASMAYTQRVVKEISPRVQQLITTYKTGE